MEPLAGLRLGFVGTGTITSAIVTGLCASGADHRIIVSPRNETVATRLASQFPQVQIAKSNQDVLAGSDVVLLSIRPQVATDVLSSLAFRPGHRVISLIATFARDRVAALVSPATAVTCAVPIPMVASHLSPTAIFPPDRIAAALFEPLGVAVEVTTEHEFQALWASTAMMSTFFTLLDSLGSWLVKEGVPSSRARDQIAMMFDGLARVPQGSSATFAELAQEFETKGGLNEQCATQLANAGVFEACSVALDAILARIQDRAQ